MWANSTIQQVNHIVCSSVTKKLYNNNGKSILSEIFPNTPLLCMDEKMIINQKLPIKINYKSPATLGSDRVAGVCGAKLTFPNKNILVIDVGTCITYDFIDKNSIYHGGAISLGLNMRTKAMHHFTANLPLIDFDNFIFKFQKNNKKEAHIAEIDENDVFEDRFDTKIMGIDTNSCLESGSFFGVVYEIRGFIDSFVSRKKVQHIIITGGQGEILLYYLNDKRVIFDANIVLKGLVNILLYNA